MGVSQGGHQRAFYVAGLSVLCVLVVVLGYRFAADRGDVSDTRAALSNWEASSANPSPPAVQTPASEPVFAPQPSTGLELAAAAEQDLAAEQVPVASARLPEGEEFPRTGEGTWRVVAGTSPRVGSGHEHTYTVEIENGVQLTEGDASFADTVQQVLSDQRGWTARGDLAVRRVDTGQPDLRVRLTSSGTARALCGFEIPVDVNCRIAQDVYLSTARWTRGAAAFGDDVAGYRQYAINHEVGHFFSYLHEACQEDGRPAPVMMQQTFSTANDDLVDITADNPQQVDVSRDGKRCTANPWPFP
jgi:predicted metalloprotease